MNDSLVYIFIFMNCDKKIVLNEYDGKHLFFSNLRVK